jgi:ATP-dependent DNA helicase RecG
MKEAGLMPPTFESNHEANKFTARLLLHHFLSKENMEWLAQYAEFGLVNEQKLALVFVREVGAIDNATYRQLDSSITHARARLEIHKLCNLGFLEKKGQGRNTYYIRTSKVVSLGERLRPQSERLLPQHGTLCERIPPQHGTLGERYQGENERYQAFEERYQGEVGTFEERYQGVNREELLLLLPDDIKKRIDEVGKRVPKDVLNKLVVDMCSIVPLSMDDLSVLLHRNSKSFKNKNIKVLLENNQLFYWIPEMINHPQQKYIADPSMTRSKTKKKKCK